MSPERKPQASDESPEARGRFQTTHWSIVTAAGGSSCTKSREAIESLCGTYYKPLYAYLRARGHSAEDGEDLLQEFFAHVLACDYFHRADPERGRFRTFLLSSLKYFLANEWRKSKSVKRGSQYTFVSWEELRKEDCHGQEPSHGLTAEKLYDKKWGLALIDAAKASLRREFIVSGEVEVLDALEGFLSGEGNPESYKAVAVRLGLSEDAVRMRVHRLRRRFGDLLRAKVADTVADRSEIADEMRHLFAVWS